MKNFLIYGSYGYTGRLIVNLAFEKGLRPILAGRDGDKLRQQAEPLKLAYRTLHLDDTDALHTALNDVEGVLHCAGPFVHTYRQMSEACLSTRRHYLDISGEIPGFEALAKRGQEAKRAGIMLLPGAGFDIVPTDCLAAHLKTRLPSAMHLKLYIRSFGGGVSRGTARSAIENMHRQGMIRENGKLVQVPPAWRVQEVSIGGKITRVVSIGWGDVSSAYYSTGIPNIQAFMAFPPFVITALGAMRVIGPLLYNRLAKSLLKQATRLMRRGPTKTQRQNGHTLLLGKASNPEGDTVSTQLRTPEGYLLTALVSVEIMQRIMTGNFKPGFQTPSSAYGQDFVMGFPGVALTDLKEET